MRSTPRLLLAFFALLFVGATTLQLLALANLPPEVAAPQLRKVIPESLPGWTSQQLPLADTEELRNVVVDTLKFDEHVSLLYRRGTTTMTIYAAYWAHGKVPPRAVGVHTPDTCWVQNGWTRTARASGIEVPGCKPAEFGTYTLKGTTQHVFFWHLVGGRPYSYEQEGMHSLTAPFKDLATFGLAQRREQLFVRLASNVPFEQLRSDAGYREMLAALAELGLASAKSAPH